MQCVVSSMKFVVCSVQYLGTPWVGMGSGFRISYTLHKLLHCVLYIVDCTLNKVLYCILCIVHFTLINVLLTALYTTVQ